jgi:flap endonuclease-1
LGVNIAEHLPKKEVDLKDLSGKVIAIDASLFLYQFITTIRQADGQPLQDSKGNITSHLTGLFSRTINLLQKGIKPVYVFDGKPPELKEQEQARRRELKDEAQHKYNEAVSQEDVESMKKYASRVSRLTPEMINEAKELLQALGVSIINAPSEAEAQGSHMVKKGDCYAIATQDSDVLMFGTPRFIRNINLAGKRKKINAYTYTTIRPEIISLSETLNTLGLEHEQYIILCMLIGTDYNIGGIKGIGPKKAMKLVKDYGTDFDELFSELKWSDYFSYPWTDVFYTIKKIPVTDDYSISFGSINEEKVIDILVNKYEFSRERIEHQLGNTIREVKLKNQKTLFDY